jgi:hypothetical protein
MRARDVVGRRIMEVRQQRVSIRTNNDGTELEYDWEVLAFRLDNGRWLTLFARETDEEAIVTAQVHKPD